MGQGVAKSDAIDKFQTGTGSHTGGKAGDF